MSTVDSSVKNIVQNGLCVGCGTCASLCPNAAITIYKNPKLGIYLPQINSSACTQCSLCYKICPGHTVDFKKLSRELFGEKTAQPDNILLGKYLNCYSGYSNIKQTRVNSSSGGIATQLLVSAMEAGLIDGALVTRMRPDKPLEPEPFIARTTEEILASSTSKYCPVAANTALKEILTHDGKYAVVGLPCHIQGIRKAQAINKKLKQRIVLTVGIFCSHGDTSFYTSYLLNHLQINPNDVSKISYRGKGWPGRLSVKVKSGDVYESPYLDWIKIHEYCFFTPDRCLVCCDHTAELADVSTGDAWLPEFSSDHIGTSVIISRSDYGEKLLQLTQLKRDLTLQSISSGSVAKSQGNIRFKKNGYPVRSFMFRLCGRLVPIYVTKLPQARLIDIPRSAIIFVNQQIASRYYFAKNIDRFSLLQKRFKKLYTSAIQ